MTSKEYYQANKELIKKQRKLWYTKNREKQRQRYFDLTGRYYEQINNLKNVPCMDCHQTFPPICMEFDHRDPNTKLASISQLIGIVRSYWEIIQQEINKCDIVCANCHRLRTAKMRGFRGQAAV